jgi:hypothetical protein
LQPSGLDAPSAAAGQASQNHHFAKETLDLNHLPIKILPAHRRWGPTLSFPWAGRTVFSGGQCVSAGLGDAPCLDIREGFACRPATIFGAAAEWTITTTSSVEVQPPTQPHLCDFRFTLACVVESFDAWVHFLLQFIDLLVRFS